MTDYHHGATAAWAGGVFGIQRDLEPRQMRRKRTAVGPALGRTLMLEGGIALLNVGFTLGDGPLEVFETELQLLLGQALGFSAELHLGPGHQQQGPQCSRALGQGGE